MAHYRQRPAAPGIATVPRARAGQRRSLLAALGLSNAVGRTIRSHGGGGHAARFRADAFFWRADDVRATPGCGRGSGATNRRLAAAGRVGLCAAGTTGTF